MNELMAMRLLVTILSFVVVGMATGSYFSIKAWKNTAADWKESYCTIRTKYDNMYVLMAEPMEKALNNCVDCPDGVDCSGCKRFSKYCKKCTEGGG